MAELEQADPDKKMKSISDTLHEFALGATKQSIQKQVDKQVETINPALASEYGETPMSIGSILAGKEQVRSRQQIYNKLEEMFSTDIMAAAVRIVASSVLGTGDTSNESYLFFEKADWIEEGVTDFDEFIVDLNAEIAGMVNRNIFPLTCIGLAFGDAYARMYAKDGKGVVGLYCSDFVRPALVIPFEDSKGDTVGYLINSGKKHFEPLSVLQMARFKMPRIDYIAQVSNQTKQYKFNIKDDSPDEVMPCSIGGSILYACEEAFNRYRTALNAITGQRFMAGVDERIIMANTKNMVKDHKQRFLSSIARVLQASKDRIVAAVQDGTTILSRTYYLLPVNDEKQLIQNTPMNDGSGSSQNFTVEDIMLHARIMLGGMGVDLSMVGFTDQLAGGLGDSNMLRTSVQMGETSAMAKPAIVEMVNHISDTHVFYKYGMAFDERKRPWKVSFFGSLSSLNAETQRTKTEAMNAALILVAGMQQFKDMGAKSEQLAVFLKKQMKVEDKEADLYAGIADIPPPDQQGFGADPNADDSGDDITNTGLDEDG